MSSQLDTPFVALAADSCPAYDEMLVALEREFRAVHREAVSDALDEAARPLFELADEAPDEQVLAIARAAWQTLPNEGAEPAHWLLACALTERCATGAVRAAVAAELARRAGIPARPVRLRGCWAIRIPGGGGQVAADVGEDDSSSGPTGDLCTHQLAFAVLTGLSEAWRDAGDRPRAQRAGGLRLLLPLGEELRSLVHEEVRALGRTA